MCLQAYIFFFYKQFQKCYRIASIINLKNVFSLSYTDVKYGLIHNWVFFNDLNIDYTLLFQATCYRAMEEGMYRM